MKTPFLLAILLLLAIAGSTAYLLWDNGSTGPSLAASSQELAGGVADRPDAAATLAPKADASQNTKAATATNAKGDNPDASKVESSADGQALNAAGVEPANLRQGATPPKGDDPEKGASKHGPSQGTKGLGNAPEAARQLVKQGLNGSSANAKRTPFSATVSGVLINELEEPIIGANISVIEPSESGAAYSFMSGQGGNFFSGPDSGASDVAGGSVSDGQGKFTMAVNGQMVEASESGKVALKVEAPLLGEYTTESFSIRRAGTRNDLIIKLYKRVTISGVVLNKKDSTPFVGAEVVLNYQGLDYRERTGNKIALVHKADKIIVGDDGKFTFPDVPGGALSVRASDPTKTLGGGGIVIQTDIGGLGGTNSDEAAVRLSISNGIAPASLTLYLDQKTKLFFRIEQVGVVGVRAQLRDKSNGAFNLFGGAFGRGPAINPNADGVYQVEGLESTHREVEISADGYAPTLVEITPVSGEDLDLGTIKLKEGLRITGVVVDATGAPIAGVKVAIGKESMGTIAVHLAGNVTFLEGLGEVSATTDAAGGFVIEGVEEGTQTLRFSHADYASAEETLKVVAGPNPPAVRVTLYQGGSVSGQAFLPVISDVSGGNTASFGNYIALIEADQASGAGYSNGLQAAGMQSKLRANLGFGGGFAITKVPAGTYTLYAYYEGRSAFVENVKVVEGQETKVDVIFAEDGALGGNIIDQDGSPYANKPVKLQSNVRVRFGDGSNTTSTDGAGNYRFDKVPVGEHVVLLEGDPQYLQGLERAKRLVRIEANSQTIKNIDLSEVSGITLKGRVTVGGRAVFKHLTVLASGRSSRTANVDGSGAFSINQVTPGDYYLWFQDPSGDGGVARVTVSVPTDAEEDLEVIRDLPAATLSGSLRGGPADIDWARTEITARPILDEPFGRDSFAGALKASTKANSLGEFSFYLVQGEYEIVVSHPDFAPSASTVYVNTNLARTFEVGGPGGTLKLKISDMLKDGKPYQPPAFSYATLALTNAQGQRVSLARDQGFFMFQGASINQEISSLPPGAYSLEIRTSLFELATTSFEIIADQTTTKEVTLYYGAFHTLKIANPEISAEALATVAIEISDANGKRIYPGNGSASVVGSTSSERQVGPLSAGSYRIVVKSDGYEPFEEAVTVTRGGESSSNITLAAKPAAGK